MPKDKLGKNTGYEKRKVMNEFSETTQQNQDKKVHFSTAPVNKVCG